MEGVHAVELEKFLVSWVMDMMCTEGHSLYRKGAGPQPQEDNEQHQGDKDKDPSRDEKADRASSPLSSESSAHKGRSQRKHTSKKKKAAEKLKRSSDESSNGSF